VINPLPKVDRRPSDPVSVIGVIVDQRNNINLIGTQRPEWTIKRMIWIWKFATDHIDVDQVKNNKEIIHRKAVYALSGYKDI